MGCSTAMLIWQYVSVALLQRSDWPRRATSITSGSRTSLASTPTGSAGSNASGPYLLNSHSTFHVTTGHQAGHDWTRDLIERGEEFVDLRSRGIGDKDDVLVVDRELLRERVGFAVAEIEAIDHRRDASAGAGGDRLIECL